MRYVLVIIALTLSLVGCSKSKSGCAAHSDQESCEADITACKWNSEKNKCDAPAPAPAPQTQAPAPAPSETPAQPPSEAPHPAPMAPPAPNNQ